jgi:hypothetical protein
MEDPLLATGIIEWSRFWRQQGNADDFAGLSDGFLVLRDELFGSRNPDDPKELSDLLEYKCLILLGEPGMGKSKTLDLHKPFIQSRAGPHLFWSSFREEFSPQSLLDTLKQSDQWSSWLAGSSLTVVLDGVDEGLELESNTIDVLVARLKGKPLERLQLILVCRDGEWRNESTSKLQTLWKKSEVACFVLERLRRRDVLQGARFWGLSEADSAEFLSCVELKALASLAARPMTLNMMVEEFREQRSLPANRIEIFRRACQRLLLEDPSRTEFLKKPTFGANEMFGSAQKIAALLVCGCYKAVPRPALRASGPGQLAFQELLPAAATARDNELVKAVLSSALFSDTSGHGRSVCEHAIAEFLTSAYLSDFPLQQTLDILCTRQQGQYLVFPQLAEVAGWLSLAHPEFQDWAIEHAPQLFLRNDFSILPSNNRARLVASLLSKMENEEEFDDWNLKRFYRAFEHPSLAVQIRPYLSRRSANWSVRRAAIHIAGLCKARTLVKDLLAVVTNLNEDVHIREEAMDALAEVITEKDLPKLEPFARREAGEDPHDELRGVALRLLVPSYWRVSDALSTLRKPSNLQFVGEFDVVCDEHLPAQIITTDLPKILSHLQQLEHVFHHPRTKAIAHRAVLLAAQKLNIKRVAKAFVDLILDKMIKYELPMGLGSNPDEHKSITDNADCCHSLASIFVNQPGVSQEDLSSLITHGFVPIHARDFPWLLDNFLKAPPESKSLWGLLMTSIRAWRLVDSWRDLFFEACSDCREVGALFNWPMETRLDSKEAKESRRWFEQEKTTSLAAQEVPRKPSAIDLFDKALADAKANSNFWPRLAWELQRTEDGARIFGISANPQKLYHWTRLGERERHVVAGVAREFLLRARPAKDDGQKLAEFWAILLVKDTIITDQELRGVVLQRWFKRMCSPVFGGTAEQQDLAKLAGIVDPSRLEACFRKQLKGLPSGKYSLSGLLASLELAWSPALSQITLNWLRQERPSAEDIRITLQFLSHHQPKAAEGWLRGNYGPVLSAPVRLQPHWQSLSFPDVYSNRL